MKFKSLLMTACFAAVAAAPAFAQETLRIGTEGTYRPWTMADANGNVTGFDADFSEVLCKKLETKCTFVVQNFDSLIPSLSSGRFDIIMTSLSISEERRQRIDFSVPYAEMPNTFVAPKDSPLAGIKDRAELLKTLAGKKVGVLNATTHAFYLQKNVPSVDLKSYDTLDQMQMDLTAGRLDAGFSDTLVWDEYLAKPANKNFVLIDVVIPSADDPETLGEGIGIGVPKGHDELKQRIDKAICELEADGTVKKISEKWFNGTDISVQCKK